MNRQCDSDVSKVVMTGRFMFTLGADWFKRRRGQYSLPSVKSSNTIGKICLTLLRHVKKCNLEGRLHWITFLVRSFVFTSFAKLMEFNTLLNYLHPQEGEKICDLGCGSGNNDILLSFNGAHIYAVDIDVDSLKYARKVAASLGVDVNYCTIDLNKGLSFKSESFDKAVSYCVLEHLSNPEHFLNEANRVLRPSGMLALSLDSFSYYNTPDEFRSIHKKICHVKKYYTKREAEFLLNRHGFSVQKCSFIINSPISSFLFKTLLRAYFRSERHGHSLPLRLFKLLTPVVLIICMISDGFYDDSRGGYWLTLLAVKETQMVS